jgi:phage repressor protein C with HTH and peptisase S24 domain
MYHFAPKVKPNCYAQIATIVNMEPWQRLKIARERAGYETASAAARAFGWPEARYRHHENGQRNFKKDSAVTYGRAFKVAPEWLMMGVDGAASDMPIFGYVGAGQEIHTTDDGELDRIEPPPGVGASAVAVIVRGESMWPRYFEGDVLVYDEQTTPGRANGQECVIAMRDGRRLVKVVRFRQGVVTLESYNAPPIENADIEWVAAIKWVRRATV